MCEVNDDLRSVMVTRAAFQTDDEAALADEAVEMLSRTFIRWASDGDRAETFQVGSRQLGLRMKGADIDLLCVISPQDESSKTTKSRSAFFREFSAILSDKPEVTRLRSVPHARIGVIKLEYKDKVKADLTFASTANVGKSLECAASLNGKMVGEAILSNIQGTTRDDFVTALAAIKLWAKSKLVYGAVVGFLGGVSTAIMLAKLCQLPGGGDQRRKTAEELVSEFFAVYSAWNWDEEAVTLTSEKAVSALDAMTVLTPTTPVQNTMFNATKSSRKILVSEMAAAIQVAESDSPDWNALFRPVEFRSRYKCGLCVTASAATPEDLHEWVGFVESKLRALVLKLDNVSAISASHINPERETYTTGGQQHCARWTIGLDLSSSPAGEKLDLSSAVRYFKSQIKAAGRERHWINDKMKVAVDFKKFK